MVRKNYTDEFRQRAVDLYESTPGATLKAIAADLGISRGALKEWADKLGSGTAAAGSVSPPVSVRSESQAARIIRLEAELAVSRAEQVKLETERDIQKRQNLMVASMRVGFDGRAANASDSRKRFTGSATPPCGAINPAIFSDLVLRDSMK